MSAIAGGHAEVIPTRMLTKARLKRLAYVALGGVIALAGARYGYDYWSVGRFIESTDDAYAGGNVTPISPHVAGFVTQILVGDNEYVRTGQPLIRLDDRDFRAAADRAAAIVKAREATLESLERKQTLQQTAIRQSKAQLDAKQAQAAFTKQDDQRYRDLAQTAAGSRQNAERASSLNLAAEASVVSSEAGLDAAKQQLTVLDAEIAVAKADVAQAEADLHTAGLNLGYTEIRSPIDGYVGNRAAQIGAYVAGGAYLITVIPAHDLWVDANFKESQLEHMMPGQAATVVADVLPDHVFRGRVLTVAPATGAVFSVIPPRTRPATSPRSFSAFLSGSSSRTTPCCARCGPGSQRPSMWILAQARGSQNDRRCQRRSFHGRLVDRERF